MWPAPSTTSMRASDSTRDSWPQMRRVGSGEALPCMSSTGMKSDQKSCRRVGSPNVASKSSATLARRAPSAARLAGGSIAQAPVPLQ